MKQHYAVVSCKHREQTCFLVTNLQGTAVCFLVANFAINSSLTKLPTGSSHLIDKCLAMQKPKIQSFVTKELEAQNKAQAEEIVVLKAEMTKLKDSQQNLFRHNMRN